MLRADQHRFVSPERLSLAAGRGLRLTETRQLLLHYGAAVLAIVLALLLTLLLWPLIQPSVSLFFVAVMVSTWYGGLGSGLLATVLATLATAYFFMPLYYLPLIGGDDILRLGAFLLTALLISSLTRARQRANEALRESKALEQQRAEFLAMLTHDIKNPLAAILGYIELLLEEIGEQGSAEYENILQRLKSSAFTICSLVDNYLGLLQIEGGQLRLAKKSLALNEVLSRVGQQYEAEARRRKIALDLQLHEGLPAVEGDPLALERVFTNLVHNALKATPAGGQVRLSSGWQDGVVAAVTDTGPGIAPEEIPSLFEKYWRAERAPYQEGTGLGLFIVKALVEAPGGRIEVKSALGQGTCFSVFLPAASAAVRT